MKNYLLNLSKLTFVALLAFSGTACSDDDDNTVVLDPVEAQLIENLAAPQQGGQGQPISGAFTKFNFTTGTSTTSETDWDIAFRGTTIAVNGGTSTGTIDEPTRNGEGGATIVDGTFASVTTAQGLSFVQDSENGFAIPSGSDNGWYNYNPQVNLVTPIPGKILVFKTRNGRYAKVEILSYYLNQDNSNPDNGRFYTFNYVYNPNEGEKSF